MSICVYVLRDADKKKHAYAIISGLPGMSIPDMESNYGGRLKAHSFVESEMDSAGDVSRNMLRK